MMDIAYLDGFAFPYAPESIQWSYTLRTSVQETLGGRVVQLLGMQANSMTISGKAGSRERLDSLAKEIVRIMKKHIATDRSVVLQLPTRDLVFNVYVQSLPNIERNVKSVAYPYSLTLKVDHIEANIRSELVLNAALQRLYKGVGYQSGWSGGGNVQEITEVTTSESFTQLLTDLLGGRL